MPNRLSLYYPDPHIPEHSLKSLVVVTLLQFLLLFKTEKLANHALVVDGHPSLNRLWRQTPLSEYLLERVPGIEEDRSDAVGDHRGEGDLVIVDVLESELIYGRLL